MLHEFLSDNRADLIDRCRLKVAQRRAPRAADVELEHGIPLFLDQLTDTLQRPSGHSASVCPAGCRFLPATSPPYRIGAGP